MSLKNKALILIGLAGIIIMIYKLWPKDPNVTSNTYTLVFFDKTLSNQYGEVEASSHKKILQDATDNLKEKGDRIKVYYINAITASASNMLPNAEVDFANEEALNAGFIDKENAKREFNFKLYELKKQTKQNLLTLFGSRGNQEQNTFTDAWGILNMLKVETSNIKNVNSKIDVLIFSDLEESMDTRKGRRDFTKNKINDIPHALKLAQEDITEIKRIYAFDSMPHADKINVKLYFPKAKAGKAEIVEYWTEIFKSFNIKVEPNP